MTYFAGAFGALILTTSLAQAGTVSVTTTQVTGGFDYRYTVTNDENARIDDILFPFLTARSTPDENDVFSPAGWTFDVVAGTGSQWNYTIADDGEVGNEAALFETPLNVLHYSFDPDALIAAQNEVERTQRRQISARTSQVRAENRAGRARDDMGRAQEVLQDAQARHAQASRAVDDANSEIAQLERRIEDLLARERDLRAALDGAVGVDRIPIREELRTVSGNLQSKWSELREMREDLPQKESALTLAREAQTSAQMDHDRASEALRTANLGLDDANAALSAASGAVRGAKDAVEEIEGNVLRPGSSLSGLGFFSPFDSAEGPIQLGVNTTHPGGALPFDPSVRTPGPSPVPLPAGGFLVLTGLGAFAMIRRRQRSNA